MWVSTAAITELNNTFPHIRNNLKFPAFLQQLTQEWLLLGDFLFSSCSSGRKHLFCRGLFCHWSTFATQIPLVSLAGKRHAHAHTRAWVWTEAFKKQSSRLFLGHKLALWLLSCKTGPGGLLWHDCSAKYSRCSLSWELLRSSTTSMLLVIYEQHQEQKH